MPENVVGEGARVLSVRGRVGLKEVPSWLSQATRVSQSGNPFPPTRHSGHTYNAEHPDSGQRLEALSTRPVIPPTLHLYECYGTSNDHGSGGLTV